MKSRALYKILSDTAEEHPDKLAVICGDEYYTYAQFKERVDKLALSLKSIGIRKDDKIAIINEKDVLRFCKDHLAHFKSPKEVIFTEELPKTGSAKICKYKLSEKYKKLK